MFQQRKNHNLPNFNETSFEFLQEQIHFESKYSLNRSCCAMPGSYRPTQSLFVLIEPNHCQIMILNIWCWNWSKQHFFVILHQLLTIQRLRHQTVFTYSPWFASSNTYPPQVDDSHNCWQNVLSVKSGVKLDKCPGHLNFEENWDKCLRVCEL